jgi:hypothetical protein
MSTKVSDEAALKMIELLQQLNSTIVENIKLQNERIARIEERLPAVVGKVTKDVGQLRSSDDGHDERDERDDQEDADQGSGTSLIADEVEGNERRDDQEDEIQEDGDQESHIVHFTEEIRRHERPGHLSSNHSPDLVYSRVESESSGGEGPSLRLEEPSRRWLEPSRNERGLFVRYPEARTWFEQNLWIPDDNRVPLIFDIDRINACKDMREARSICERLHNFNAMLIKNGGRLCIIDNDDCGNNRVFAIPERKNTRSIEFERDEYGDIRIIPDSIAVEKNIRSIEYYRDEYGSPMREDDNSRSMYELNSFGGRCPHWRRSMYP